MKKYLALGAAAFAFFAATGQAHAAMCRAGDPPIHVNAHTSCALGGAAVNYAYNRAPFHTPRVVTLRSTVTHKSYTVKLTPRWHSDGWTITGTGAHGIWMHFYYDIGGF